MYHDLARMYSTTAGTGTLSLTTAVFGFLTFADAGVANAEVVRYGIRDGAASETGIGTYTSAGTTLSRDRILASTNSNNAINCSGSEEVFITALSFDLNALDPYGLHHRLSGVNTWDDEFSSDTSGSYTAVTPTGTATWTIANHSLNAVFYSQSASDAACYLKSLTISDGQWIETCVHVLTVQSVNYTMTGLVLTDGTATSSNCVVFNVFQSSAAAQMLTRYDLGTITNLSSSGSSVALDAAGKTGGIRLRLRRTNSTTYYWEAAPENGGAYSGFGAATFNPGFTPTHGGVWVSSWGGSHRAVASFDYLRLMS